jgi:hypothetical protein
MLAGLDVPFTVRAPPSGGGPHQLDPPPANGRPPVATVCAWASAAVRPHALEDALTSSAQGPPETVLGVNTLVVAPDGRILGTPRD